MKKLLLALTVLGFAAAPALAAPSVEFSTADADANGEVTMEEATAAGLTWTEEQFAQSDTDQNGSLSEDEYNAAS